MSACARARSHAAFAHLYTAASLSECVTLCRYVQVAIPTPFDKTAHNGLEQYVWNTKKNRVDVTYTFNEGSFTGKQTVVKQKGRANPDCSTGAKWQARARVPAILRDAILSAYSVCARTRILHPAIRTGVMRVVWAGEALARVLLHASLAGLLHSRYRHQGLLVSCGLLSRDVGIRGMDVHNDSSGLLLFAVAFISLYAA